MDLFITGGTGYIGTRTVEVALRQGHAVSVLTRSEQHADALRKKGARPVIGDLTKGGPWQEEIARAAYVIHLASPPSWTGGKVTRKLAEAYQRGHYAMTISLMESLNQASLKKLVYVAGTSYFGDTGDGEPRTEAFRSEPKGWGPYIAPSVDALPAYVKKGLPVVTAFPTQIYGADSWLPQLFLEPLSRNKPVYGLKGYRPFASPIHIEDCARALIFLLERGGSGESYILADDKPVPLEQFTPMSARLLGAKPRMQYVPKWLFQLLMGPVLTEYATAHTNFSNEKLKSLGFDFLYPTCEEGLPGIVAEWQQKAGLQR